MPGSVPGAPFIKLGKGGQCMAELKENKAMLQDIMDLRRETEVLKAEVLRLAQANARLRESLRGWAGGDSWDVEWLLGIIAAMEEREAAGC